jgi:hypothetical protein
MTKIYLTNAVEVALVDDIDSTSVNLYDWRLQEVKHCSYAVAAINKKPVLMHHYLLGNTNRTDHRDGNGLNNCRSNLRSATHQQNMQNSRKHKMTTSSKYKGVYWDVAKQLWVAKIICNGIRYRKMLHSEIEAAKIYDAMAIELHGEFACINFPQGSYGVAVIEKGAEEAPGGIETEGGTVIAGSEEESVTEAPPAGAARFKVTVQGMLEPATTW